MKFYIKRICTNEKKKKIKIKISRNITKKKLFLRICFKIEFFRLLTNQLSYNLLITLSR